MPQAPDDRTEEEFESLGEGALYQIARSAASILGSGATVTALVATFMWGVAGLGSEERLVAAVPPALDTTQVAMLERPDLEPTFFIGSKGLLPEDASGTDVAELEVDVEVSAPAVVETAAAEDPVVRDAVVLDEAPSPLPVERDVALSVMSATGDPVVEEGSDSGVADAETERSRASRVWVSVMIPKARPTF